MNRILLGVSVTLATLPCTGCGLVYRKPLPTVSGPEDPGILGTISGHVVISPARGEIIVISLPSLEKTTIPPREAGRGSVALLAGPDATGRVVYVEDGSGNHYVRSVGLNGNDDRLLFSGSGQARRDDALGPVSLHPMGRKLAYLGKLERLQMRRPSLLLHTGPVRVRDLESGTEIDTGVQALDRPIVWFPDGRRLLCVVLVPLNAGPEPPDLLKQEHANWDRLPAVSILDTSTGETTFFHWGWHGTLSPGGEVALVQVGIGRSPSELILVDVENRTRRAVQFPGNTGSPIAMLGPDLVLFNGLPTEGTKPEFSYNPWGGARPLWSLKVANLSTGAFCTVVPHVQMWSRISCGLSDRSEKSGQNPEAGSLDSPDPGT